MIGIVIVAHGNLAHSLSSTINHVLDQKCPIQTITLHADDDCTAKQSEICEAVCRADQGQGVVIATDLHGSSPCNLSLKACNNPNQRVVYGANVPLLIKLYQMRHKPLDTAIKSAIKAARLHINCLGMQVGAEHVP